MIIHELNKIKTIYCFDKAINDYNDQFYLKYYSLLKLLKMKNTDIYPIKHCKQIIVIFVKAISKNIVSKHYEILNNL